MEVETVITEHGLKEHLVDHESDKVGLYGVVTYCGHTHFSPEPRYEYDTVDDAKPSLCQRCEEIFMKRHNN